jgi:hypothetical protein
MVLFTYAEEEHLVHIYNCLVMALRTCREGRTLYTRMMSRVNLGLVHVQKWQRYDMFVGGAFAWFWWS